ncbi:helix-turn-helix domain-containing protein [Actinobacillus ureae]|uniref:RodZ domain-containing protein n=1 Tax=Actinobacillus ureae TaxID=723 RepID=UPI000E14C8AE|nr:RodZ domain-containing protein [Actinobacillus ureae]SUT87389.1 helix-turn-helix domain-containing protein [Actinobacillus ureae]SUU48756.1 helix-turn-helix domain-containing protein [Actinobacillus ureae]
MTESINPTEENQDVRSLGKKIKQAREALNLSVEDVAKKTNLKKSHIEALENDIFILQNVAPTFVRGYVRNYLRFLRLPEELVSSVNYGEVTIPKEAVKTPSAKAVQKSQTQWMKYLTVLVLLAAAGMTLLWWWQDYQKEQENRDQFVISSTPAEVAPSVPVTPAPVTVAPQPAQPVAPAVVEEVKVPEVTAPVVNTPAVESAPVTVQSEVVAAEQPAEAVNVLQQTAETGTTEETIGNDELRIEVIGKESWITVKNTKSKRSLAEKLYSNGEVLTFNGNEQYRLTIGAPANVKLYYKGQEVPLKIDGRVARIRLPLAQ